MLADQERYRDNGLVVKAMVPNDSTGTWGTVAARV